MQTKKCRTEMPSSEAGVSEVSQMHSGEKQFTSSINQRVMKLVIIVVTAKHRLLTPVASLSPLSVPGGTRNLTSKTGG